VTGIFWVQYVLILAILYILRNKEKL